MHRILLSFILLVFCSCNKPSFPAPSESKPLVLVSIAPYAYFVERIAGQTVEVSSIVPSGVNMHVYEPTVQELTHAQRAKLWFRIGEPFEVRIQEILLPHSPEMKVDELWKGIPLLEGDDRDLCHPGAVEETKDMHIWTSPRLAAQQCKMIEEALVKLLPENAGMYAANLQALENDLMTLDQEIHTLLDPIAGSGLLVSHPAFGYFCHEYDLIQLSIECSGKEPLPKDLEHILNQSKLYHVRAVFEQLGYNNKGAELVAKRLHLPIFLVDPYARDYIHNFHQIAELIVR